MSTNTDTPADWLAARVKPEGRLCEARPNGGLPAPDEGWTATLWSVARHDCRILDPNPVRWQALNAAVDRWRDTADTGLIGTVETVNVDLSPANIEFMLPGPYDTAVLWFHWAYAAALLRRWPQRPRLLVTGPGVDDRPMVRQMDHHRYRADTITDGWTGWVLS